jgi:heat shock protein HtpX
MIGTLAFIIAASTLFFTVLLSLIGAFRFITVASLVVIFNLVQWLIAPYLINALYRVREISRSDNPKLYGMVERLSEKIHMKMPRVMIADIPIPNAFAYGSPIAGRRVAVTKGLLNSLEDEEIEAVLGHELGHLKHRDVQIMMFASVLPAIFYFIGYSLMLSGMFRGGRRNGEGGIGVLIGMICIAMYWVLSLFVLGLSRQREYYADRRSAMIVEDGPRKLSEALAKIVYSSAKMKRSLQGMANLSSFKSLFIDDPDKADSNAVAVANVRSFSKDERLVQDILSRKVTMFERFLELFSTHPNIVKRLRALQKLSKT